MESLQQALEKNTPTQCLLALVMAAGIVALLVLTQRMALRFFLRRVAAGASVPVHLALSLATHTRLLFQLAVGVALGMLFLNLPAAWEDRVRSLLAVAVALQTGYWGHHIILLATDVVGRQDTHRDSARDSARNIVRLAISTLIWAGVGLLVLENLGVNVSALVAGLGVTGVAVALATQNIVGDLFASVSILLDKPFQVGDFIIVDSFMGSVERIGVRTTRLRSLSGEEIVLANGDLSKSRIRNYRTMPERRVVFTFNIRYETPPALVRRVPGMVREAITQVRNTRFDRAEQLVFGEAGLGYEVVYYVKGGDYNEYTRIQQEINYGIMERFADAGVGFGYRTIIHYNAALPDTWTERTTRRGDRPRDEAIL